MKISKYTIIFIIIICIAAFFRFYQLSSVPPSPSVDEVATGYNAYSILHTGRGEHGGFLPIVLRSYDDYRPALYTYFVIPFIQMFGLTVLAVRLPAAILSLLTVVAIYFFIKDFFSSYKYNKELALVTAFLLAINPWHIYISRLGFEANAGIAFFIFSLLFFFKRSIFLAIFFLGLSFISYQSEKIFIPLIAITVIVLFYKELLQQKKQFIISFIVMGLLLIPFFQASFSSDALLRFRGTNIITANENSMQKQAFDKQRVLAEAKHDQIGVLLHSGKFYYTEIIISSYFSHFVPEWLFYNKGHGQFKAPDVGLLYLFTFPLIIIGVLFFLKLSVSKNKKIFLFSWMFLSPIPAAITTGAPHAVRTYPFVFSLLIFAGIGFVVLVNIIRNKFYKITILFLFLIFSFIAIKSFFISYFYLFPKLESESFEYAFYQAIQYVTEHQNEYKKIVISNRRNLYQSYMYYLFNDKYDPKMYLSHGGTQSGGYEQIHTIGKIEFRPINWSKEEKNSSILYIGNPTAFPYTNPFLKLYYLDGKEGVYVVKG